MNTIGLDIGTTSICGVRINCETGEAEKTLALKNSFWINGGAPFERLQDAEKIFETVLLIANELKDEHTAAIGLTGQMHGIVYLDSTGRAISPLYTWQDERGNQPYKSGTYASYLNSCTGFGNVTHFYNEINKIVPDSAAAYCTIHDYALHGLPAARHLLFTFPMRQASAATTCRKMILPKKTSCSPK